MVETSNPRRDEQRFLGPLGGGGGQEEDERHYGRPRTYVDLSEDPRIGTWSSSSAWGASAGRSFVGGGGVEDSLSTPVAAYISRKPVRYVSSASSHASSTRARGESDFYHGQQEEEEDNEGDVEDSNAYTPAPNRISRTTSTFGLHSLPPSTSTTTSPRQYRSNLPSLSSPPRPTFPPPPDFSPPPPINNQAKFVLPNRPAPKPPISIDTKTSLLPSNTDVDAFPSPPGISFHRSRPQLSSDPNPNPYAYHYLSHTHGLISPPSSDEISPSSCSPSNHFFSHSPFSHNPCGPANATAASPPPPREAPDLMLGSVWDEEYEEEEEEFRVGGGRRGGVAGLEGGAKRLSTIQSETGREE